MALTQPGRGSISGTVSTQSGRGSVSGYEVVWASRDFRTLRRRFGSFSLPACVLFFTWYFLYVIIAVFAPGFMRIRVFGEVNVGLCFGALQFAVDFAIAIGYRRWAGRDLTRCPSGCGSGWKRGGRQ